MTRIEELKEQIRKHEYLYYVLSTPEISDYEYDQLMKTLEELEKQDPSSITSDSPTQRVGSDLTKKFEKINHSRPMLSISNVYSDEELIDFDRKIKEALGTESYSYITELKIDGVAIALQYENGELVQAITRGDGKIGDNVTNNVKTLKSIPLKISSLTPVPDFEVRGEIYMDRDTFNRLNKELPPEEKLQNPRNAASGALKLQDPQEVAKRGLKFIAHFVFGSEWEKSHYTNLKELRKLWFPIEPHSNKCNSIQEVIAYCKSMDEIRKTIGFDTDGVVVKVDLISQHEKIGYTAKSPKWVVAFKYKAEEALTKLLSVDWQVGRTGVLTPVARLEPVFLSGSTISNATLHNYEEMTRLGLHQNDWVWLEKGGEIIPSIIRVETSKREINPNIKGFGKCPDCIWHEAKEGCNTERGSKQCDLNKKPLIYQPPNNCPICGTPVIRIEEEVAIRCPNTNCPAQVQAQIEHFVSRGAMNMEDIGPSLIDQLLKTNLIKHWDDLYKLSLSDLSSLDRMGSKSAQNVLNSIKKSKNNNMSKVLFALGIRHVGQGMANNISAKINNIWNLKEMTTDELQKIPDIGETVAESVYNWFRIPNNIARLSNLEKYGVCLNKKEISEGGPLSDKIIVVTGTLKNFSRDSIKEFIRKQGGKAASSVSKKTDYVIVGENPGSKFNIAQQLGIKILSEEDFINTAGKPESEISKPKIENLSLFN